jgi:hypothetical protein
MGKVGDLSVTDQFRRSLHASRTEDPFVIAKAIKDSNWRNDKMPNRKIFGNDLPTSVTTISPIHEKNFKWVSL